MRCSNASLFSSILYDHKTPNNIAKISGKWLEKNILREKVLDFFFTILEFLFTIAAKMGYSRQTLPSILSKKSARNKMQQRTTVFEHLIWS